MNNHTLKTAIVQWKPVHLDLAKTTEKALKAIRAASAEGAQLVVFGETWFSGYPAWLDYSPEIAYWDHPPVKRTFGTMLDNCLTPGGEELAALKAAAKKHGTALVIGANEHDPASAKGTIYNSIFTINEQGELVNHHRKLMPTYTEKMLYGHGDGAGLRSNLLSGARVTSAICWEHWMPLMRQALHDSGEQVHVALWPKVHEMHQIASRQYAFEGRCFVLAAGQMLRAGDFPEGILSPDSLSDNHWVLNGGSCVIGPDGRYVVEPVFDKETIIYAELPLQRVKEESLTLDVSGHYQREDVFTLSVNRSRK